MSADAPTVRVTRRFAAPPERVFDAWLNVDQARRFFFATAAGQIVRAEIDPRVGGRFVFTDRRGDADAEHVGEYLEIDRPRRLVFRFSAGGTDATRVSIDITPLADGCELTLTHEMHPDWADYRDRTEAGWTKMLDGLAAVVEG
jgi:uncharacterized protein YndB with AHSA1/START domain